MKEQIEHIAKVIHDSDIADINTFPISMSECLGKHGARRTGAAIALVKAGYHKQIEGGWEHINGNEHTCKNCSTTFYGFVYDFNFCPYCGAKMKGE